MSKPQGRLKLKPISKPFEDLHNHSHFDALVVGSGYGGAISACRLASTGKKVALLERGKEILPGDYPTNLTDLQSHSQIRTDNAPEKLLGKADGLYDLRVNEDVSVIVGFGLGGTSLINANVALEIDERLIEKNWPAEFNTEQGRKELNVGYGKAREMLGSTPYPDQDENSGYKTLNKLKALGISAEALGVELKRPPINVNFKDQINAAGIAQPACNLCGDCCSGCNHGAKNTTLMNYLPQAQKLGAQIYTLCSVDYLQQGKNRSSKVGWRVHVFNTVQPEKKLTVSADVLILAAGTLGSTEIMLRSKQKGLSCSDRLGDRFSGNGDVLAFGYNSYWSEVEEEESNANGKKKSEADLGAFNPLASVSEPKSIYSVGQGDNQLTEEQMPGPCITGLIDLREGYPLNEAMVIEEGVAPGIFSSIIPPSLFVGAMGEAKFFKYGPMEAVSRLKDIQKIGETMQTSPGSMGQLCYEGAVSRTQNYLVMSVDNSAGKLKLVNDHVTVDWPNAGEQKAFQHDNQVLAKANDAIQGQFLASPLWSEAMGKKLVSVHPIGGCAMADSIARGVVNHKSQVFSAETESSVYDDLYICDGSIIPGAAGVNPLLTISALTERACTYLIADHGWDNASEQKSKVFLRADQQTHVTDRSYQVSRTRLDVGNYVDTIYRRQTEAVNIGAGTENKAANEAANEEKSGEENKPSVMGSSPTKGVVQSGASTAEPAAAGLRVQDQPRDKISFIDAVRVILSIYELRTLAKKIEKKREESGQEEPSPRERKAWALVSTVVSNLFDLYKRDFSPSFQFTEQMQGFVDFNNLRTAGSLGPVSDAHKVAYQMGRAEESSFAFELTIKADDLNSLVEEPGYRCEISQGTIYCSELSVNKIPVEGGEFHFLHADQGLPDTWIMTYSVDFIHAKNLYRMKGRKSLHGSTPYQWWTDMTELAVDLYQGQGEAEKLIARGQLKLSLQQFLHQVATFKTAPRCNSIGLLLRLLSMKYPYLNQLVGLTYLSKLAAYTAEIIFQTYGGLLSDLSNFPKQEVLAETKPVRKLKAPHPVVYAAIPTADGKTIRLTRYNGGGNAVVLAPGMGVNASSFATPTVSQNLVEFLTRGTGRGNYDVWLLDYRASFDSGSSTEPFNIDDIARYDWPAAVSFITKQLAKEELPAQLQAIVHCVGSMSLLLSLLQGHVDRKHFSSLICSQLTLHPVTNWQNNAKADLKVAKDLEDLVDMFNVEATVDMNAGVTDFDRAFDVFSYEFPKPPGEQCNNPVCNRVMTVYGPSYLHDQLNHQTHIHMRDWFKAISLRPFEQLSKMMAVGYVVDAEGNNSYLTHPYVNSENPGLQVAGLDLPITFIAGGRNLEFLPETSQRTLAWLKAHNSDHEDQYDRHVFADYGHMDCFIGKTADEDIFPYLMSQLQRRRPNRDGGNQEQVLATTVVAEQ